MSRTTHVLLDGGRQRLEELFPDFIAVDATRLVDSIQSMNRV